MKEKLIIKNFGPIKSVELDLGRFNILIGEQATGKSTVAKILAVCRYFSYIYEYTFTNGVSEYFQLGLEAWGLSESIQNDTYIKYTCYHYSVETEFDINNKIFPKVIPISNEFKHLIEELDSLRPLKDFSSGVWNIPINFFYNYVSKVLDNPFYFPTERGLQSVFSLGQGGIRNINNFLFNYFSKVDEINEGYILPTNIEPLKIQYINKNGVGYIKGSNIDYKLSNSASGYQSTIPVVLVIKHYKDSRKEKKTFIIEEPELNLFPSAQNELMKYLVNNTISNGNSLLLTTHSPYILASINNLIYAYNVGQTNKEAVNTVIAEKYWLDPSLVSAYRLLPDGTAKNIIDEELKEIIVEEIDGVSKLINGDYDKILDIKFSANEMSE